MEMVFHLGNFQDLMVAHLGILVMFVVFRYLDNLRLVLNSILESLCWGPGLAYRDQGNQGVVELVESHLGWLGACLDSLHLVWN